MPSPNHYRRFVLNLALNSSCEKRWNPRYRETLATQMLSTLSVALGLAALLNIPEIWFGFSCINQSIDRWLNPPQEFMMSAASRRRTHPSSATL